MKWSPQQDAALRAVSEWLKNPGDKQVFRLFGWAGTGKTTLAIHAASGVDGDVLFAAFTGKAAYVMQQRGCVGATTIHRLIYKPKEKSKERLRKLQQEVELLTNQIVAEHGGDPNAPAAVQALTENRLLQRLKKEIDNEHEGLKRPAFTLNEDSDLRKASLLILDECSMVDEIMAQDLMSFGCPILVLGDPAQLPPVRGTGFFTEAEPDIMLTEIHRQSQDNPIIRLATIVREGGQLELGDYGQAQVIGMEDGDPSMYTSHDQVLLGRERRPEHRSDPIYRANMNRRIRSVLGRGDHVYPVPGDKVICLRNNHQKALLNGGTWTVLDSQELDGKVSMTIRGDTEKDVVTVEAHSKLFRGEELMVWEINKETDHFDYGYAMTVHKAQGSQWPSVLVFDQSRIFRNEARRWLYTAITRAAERLTVIKC